jgi:hypothetical protein
MCCGVVNPHRLLQHIMLCFAYISGLERGMNALVLISHDSSAMTVAVHNLL